MSPLAHYFLLGVASGIVADAFRLPSGSRANNVNHAADDVVFRSHQYQSLPTLPRQFGHFNNLRLSLSKSDDADLSKGIETFDTKLSREIEEALSLAQIALAVEAEVSTEPKDEDEGIENLADMLLEKPPDEPEPVPLPPMEEPPESVIALSLAEEEVSEDVKPPEPIVISLAEEEVAKENLEPPAPKTPPESVVVVSIAEEEVAEEDVKPPAPENPAVDMEEISQKKEVAEEDVEPPEPETPAVDMGAILQKKLAEEMDKLKNIIFGINEELGETEASTKVVEDTAAALKKEIEESVKEREAMVKEIEDEVAAEKERLVYQLGIASGELKAVMDQSARDITDAESKAKSKATRVENELISRIDSFKATIDKVSAEIIGINTDKEQKEGRRQSMLELAVQEGKDKLAKFQKSLEFDLGYAKQNNEALTRRAEEAEGKIRQVYDQINQMREERVSLQQQIVDVEKEALEQVATIERQIELDDERYATALKEERDRMENIIDEAYQAYAVKICEKIVERQAVEDGSKGKLGKIDAQINSAKAKQKARVKEYLDNVEEKHKKERIEIYQDRFEAVSAIRKQLNADLAIEYAKLEEIRETMRAKIDAVHDQTAEVKALFEEEIAKKRQLAKEEEEELQREIDDVRVDMTDKIKAQRRHSEEIKAAYLEDMNGQISDSEVELRQQWRELAGYKQSCDEVGSKRDTMIDNVTAQQSLIDSYESDQKSFRKSLKLTVKAAKGKIGSKTRRLLGKDKSRK